MKALLAFILGTAFIALIVLGMAYLDTRDSTLSRLSDCVATTAKAQGYTGNVHGPEAYDLFIGSCR